MSGLTWYGATETRQLPFRRLFRPILRPVPTGAQMVTAYTDGEVTLRSRRSKASYHEAADMSAHQGVMVGDFVVHGLDIMRGSVGVSDASGAISSVCTVCAPVADVNPYFVAYVMRAQAAAGLPKALARGVREGGADFRRWDTLGELPIPVPSRKVQDVAVAFLRAETAEIDAFIADQEQLIALLEERRIARISQSITRAADGALWFHSDWLGSVPAGLPLGRVGTAYSITLGKMLHGASATGEVTPYVRAGNVQPYGLDLTEVATMLATSEERQRLDLRRGDVVVVEGGAGYGRSDVLTVNLEGWIFQNHVIRARPRAASGANGKFLNYWLRVLRARGRFEALSGFATMPNLSAEKLKATEIPLLSAEQQYQVVVRLDAETASIDAAIADARQAITLSKERRAALISAAVTGRIVVTERRRVLV